MKNVDMETGDIRAVWVDSLSAFWPGLQVLAGHVEDAIHTHQFYFTIGVSFILYRNDLILDQGRLVFFIIL